MVQHHSSETHRSLLDRIPDVTGRDIDAWLSCLDSGPTLLRFDERVAWLRDEHGLPQCYAQAIVHEHDLRRAAIRA